MLSTANYVYSQFILSRLGQSREKFSVWGMAQTVSGVPRKRYPFESEKEEPAMKKRVLSLGLTLCMLVGLLPTPVLAAENGVHCVHVHDESCGYVEAAAEVPCGHIHDETCGWAAPGEGTPCAHVHDGDCGFVEAVSETPCIHTHDGACGYTAPSGGTPCPHVHDESCGFVEAAAEVSCSLNCEDTDGDGVIDHAADCL